MGIKVKNRILKLGIVMMFSILVLADNSIAKETESAKCYDFRGNAVDDGEKYIPNKDDPCMTCICDKGFRIMCRSVACSPPGNCALWEQIDGVCCEYKCIKSGSGNNVQGGGIKVNTSHPNSDPGIVPDDESITNLGLRLVASTVTSFLVLALLLFMIHRLRQRRLLLAMRRFEAHARRQQLDEIDSDQYMPETFLGLSCPPYEEPPPPYSPPKPRSHILPGEAPPPYEEIDQNPSVPLHNNNNINNRNNSRMDESQQQNRNEVYNSENICMTSLAGQPSQDQVENMYHVRNSADISRSRGVSVLPDANGHMHMMSENTINNTNNESNNCRDNHIVESPTRETPLLSPTSHADDCSCDNEQTLLKTTFPLQPTQVQHQQETVLNMSSTEILPHLNSVNPNMTTSLTEHTNHRSKWMRQNVFASLPSNVRYTDNYINKHLPKMDVTGFDNSTQQGHSSKDFCLPARTAADGSSRQDLFLTFQPINNAVPTPFNSILVPNQGQASVQSSEAKLKNLRLTNDPPATCTKQESPLTPDEQPIERSQSVSSEASVFSICSETGEPKLPRSKGRALRNDCTYPDIMIRPELLKQLVGNVEDIDIRPNNSRTRNDIDRQRSEVNTRQKEATSSEKPNSHGNGVCELDPLSSVVKDNFSKLNSELKDKIRKKEKPHRNTSVTFPSHKTNKPRNVTSHKISDGLKSNGTRNDVNCFKGSNSSEQDCYGTSQLVIAEKTASALENQKRKSQIETTSEQREETPSTARNLSKPNVKRRLISSDKKSVSHGVNGNVKSRSKSSSQKDSVVSTWNNLSKDSNTCVPKRKTKASTKSKNRQSYPVSNMQSAESSGIVLSRPNILGCVADLTNEIVPGVEGSSDSTLLNGYKYHNDQTDTVTKYSSLRPTRFSSYV